MLELFDGVTFKCSIGEGVTNEKLNAIESAVGTLCDNVTVGISKGYEGYYIHASANGFDDSWKKSDYNAVAAMICSVIDIDEVNVNPQKGSRSILLKESLPENEKSYIYYANKENIEEEHDDTGDINDIEIPLVKEDRDRRARRRKEDKKHKNRMKDIADSRHNESSSGKWHILSPWFSDEKGRVVMPKRGKISKYLKKQANKKARKTPLATKGNSHKKAYGYKNKLI